MFGGSVGLLIVDLLGALVLICLFILTNVMLFT